MGGALSKGMLGEPTAKLVAQAPKPNIVVSPEQFAVNGGCGSQHIKAAIWFIAEGVV
jgi:hypothetical protein